MPPPTEYKFDYSIIVCIDATNKLQVYWAQAIEGGDPTVNTYALVIEKTNWDGSAVTGSVSSPDNTYRCDGQELKLTATSAGNLPDGSTIVDVDYESSCTSPSRGPTSGTQTVIVNIGASCPIVT